MQEFVLKGSSLTMLNLSKFSFFLLLVRFGESAIHQVDTTLKLQAALRNVQPGDVIQLAEVEFSGFFRAEVSGTEQNRITIQGTKNSILTSWSSAFNLEASWYILKGLKRHSKFF